MNKKPNRAASGALGEALARTYLEDAGYRYLDSNYVRRVGELDLIMLEPAGSDGRRTLVFVEVRYRTPSIYGGALGSIDWKKQRKLIRVADLWLQRHASVKANARIDFIAIEPITSVSKVPTNPDTQTWRNHHLLWIKNAIESP